MSTRVSSRKRKEPERLSDESSLQPKKARGRSKTPSKKTVTKRSRSTSTKKPAAKKAKTSTKKASTKKTTSKKSTKTTTPKKTSTKKKSTTSSTKKKASTKKKTSAKKPTTKKTASTKKASASASASRSPSRSRSRSPSPSPKVAASPKVKPTKSPKAAPKAAAGDGGVKEQLQQLSLDQLKERLRANDGLVSGSKSDLIKRIADGVANGAPPRCPQCFGGRLKKSGKNWVCPGFHDGDHFRRCSYKTDKPELVAWKKEAGKDY